MATFPLRGDGVTLRILLVDDQPLVRAGLRQVFDTEPDLEVVGEAGDGLEAIAQAAATTPDVVVMDVRMPRMDGIEATRRILASADPPRVLVLTTFDEDEYAYAALRAGASAFLIKDAPVEQLVQAVHVVADGHALLAPTTTRRLVEAMVSSTAPTTPPPELARLTAREHEVLIAHGARTDQPGHRARAVPQRVDRQDPREPGPHQARAARPGAGRDRGVRVGTRAARAVADGLATGSVVDPHDGRPGGADRGALR